MTKHTSINIARMQYRLEFQKMAPTAKTNPNTGRPIKEYQTIYTKWAGKWSISQTMQLNLAGAGIKDAIIFFIRHDELITSDFMIKFQGNQFKIDNINYDDGITSNGFDLITCHREVVDHA